MFVGESFWTLYASKRPYHGINFLLLSLSPYTHHHLGSNLAALETQPEIAEE